MLVGAYQVAAVVAGVVALCQQSMGVDNGSQPRASVVAHCWGQYQYDAHRYGVALQLHQRIQAPCRRKLVLAKYGNNKLTSELPQPPSRLGLAMVFGYANRCI